MEKAVRVLLVRHGETEWNRRRIFQGRGEQPLNERGREQVLRLAFALQDEPIQAIYTSTLVRAVETASLIRSFHPAVPFIREEGLVEMDLGEFDGMEAETWAAQFPEFRKAWRDDPSHVVLPGGESLAQVQARAFDALQRISGRHLPETTILVSGHNFVNRAILCRAMGIPLARFRELKQDTAALNVLYRKDDRLWAEVVNHQAHLEESSGPAGSIVGLGEKAASFERA